MGCTSSTASSTSDPSRSWGPAGALLLLAASCAPATLYVPSPVLAPMFSKGGQFHTSAQAGPQGVQLNAAYTAGRNIMVRVSGHAQDREDGHYQLITAGAGWFLAYVPRRAELFQGWRASANADFGFADARGAVRTATTARAQYSANIYRIGLQADFGVDLTYVEAAAVARFVYLSARHTEDSALGGGATADWWLIEPAIVVRGGLETLKLELQAGYSEPLSQGGFLGDYRRWWGTLGIAAVFR